MTHQLTLMAVHAHPDDEVLGTGGLLARCAAEGIRTVLVTCTNGEQGDDAGGVKPGEPGHNAPEVAERRLAELRESAGLLGIGHVELLGYRDSGMAGWSTNDDPEAFANVPLDESAGRLAALMEHYRPQVVVTYDENGGYGHPDHIQAHRIALAAAEKSGVPDKLYYTAIPRSGIKQMFETVREAGVEIDFDPPEDFGTPDELITSTLDVSAHVEVKRKALQAHASQGENIFLLRLPEEAQQAAFSFESFVRHHSRVAAPDKEEDLFDGLR
ncbi:PIG-L family deacetylase [Actinomadura sp. 3N407]|uniref:PIG-L family deacetylase n=1 Tax=Actinomadura sp. 3N407 TaxID=3457423 RepID=UPI003FCC7A10